jgi:hypothetical protein
MATNEPMHSGAVSPNPRVPMTFCKEYAVTILSFVLFALIVVSLAAVILSVVAGDAEFITRPQGRFISTTALTLAVASGVILMFVSFLAASNDRRPGSF